MSRAQAAREHLGRAIRRRKIGSFRLSEYINPEMTFTTGLSEEQIFIEFMWALKDFKPEDFIESD